MSEDWKCADCNAYVDSTETSCPYCVKTESCYYSNFPRAVHDKTTREVNMGETEFSWEDDVNKYTAKGAITSITSAFSPGVVTLTLRGTVKTEPKHRHPHFNVDDKGHEFCRCLCRECWSIMTRDCICTSCTCEG